MAGRRGAAHVQAGADDTMGWIEAIEHNRWLSHQMQALLEQGRAAWAPTGFGYFTPDGKLDETKPVDLAITARMTFAYSLGTLMGIPGCRKYGDHGVQCLQTYFRDREHGGWFSAIEHEPDEAGRGVPWPDGGEDKWAYAHAFLLLAAATATNANRPGAYELLQDALQNQLDYWYDEDAGAVADRYSRDWSVKEPYRGMNSLMHTVEAYLAAAEAAQEVEWLERAEKMLARTYEVASEHNWRVPEHYDENWRPMLDYNVEAPATPYYPYGYVIGHGMELARLGAQLRAGLREEGLPEPDYLLKSATEMFHRAREDGWRGDGKSGFLFTTDFEGDPVLTERLSWVLCEGICAAVALRRGMLDDGAADQEVEHFDHAYQTWMDYLHDEMLLEEGVLARTLNEDSEPMEGTIASRPDIYHPIQALLVSRLPLWPPMGAALHRGLLDSPQGAPQRTRPKWGRKRAEGSWR